MSDEIWCCNGIILYHNLYCLYCDSVVKHILHILVIQDFWWSKSFGDIILFWWSKTFGDILLTKMRWQVVSKDVGQNQTIWWSKTFGDLTFSFCKIWEPNQWLAGVEWCHNQTFHSQLLHLSILFDIGYNLQNYFCNLLTFISFISIL